MHKNTLRTNVLSRSLVLLSVLILHCGSDVDGEPITEQLAAMPSIAAWAAAPQDATEGFGGQVAVPSLSGQSIRQLLRVSASGEGLRVHLSNLYGAEPLMIQAAAVAPSMGSGSIDTALSVGLTFDGSDVAMVPPGQEVWSDFAPLAIDAGQELAVTLYMAGTTAMETAHNVGLRTAYVASGNAVAVASLPAAYQTTGPDGVVIEGSATEPADDGDANTTTSPVTSYYWITGVDVAGDNAARRVMVAFGDSITDGVGSSIDGYSSYPDLLAQRLEAEGADRFSVVNVGISANRILNDGIGQRGLERFGRDVLTQTGVSDVVILLGINDIGFSGINPDQSVTADEITAGLATMIAEANAAGAQVRLGTLTPLEGTAAPYYSEDAEIKRGVVNEWIRANTDVASIIDFDEVMQDPQNPLAMLPAYDSGDNLHPGDEGYRAMAAVVVEALSR